MTASLLILGGTGFVGPSVIHAALRRGWEVTAFHRGRRGTAREDVEHVLGDRTVAGDLRALAGRDWDVVLDTWSGPPRAVHDSARTLADHAGRYVYISSCSVYSPPPPVGLDETAPTVPADPDATHGDYAELKRGAELAVSQTFSDRALLLRLGLILGPGEDVGRLPWWLARMAAGGSVLCPGPAELPLQFIDARDLAVFALDAAVAGEQGPINTVSPRGHATMGDLLSACRDVAAPPQTTLQWVDPDVIEAAGIEPWTELPIWIPPGHDYEGMHGADVGRAVAAGLRCRPVTETVSDTWTWMQSFGAAGAPRRADLPAPGLDPERERAVLQAV